MICMKKKKTSYLFQQRVEKHPKHYHLLLLYHVLPCLTVYMVFFSYNLLHDAMQIDFVFEKHNRMKKDVVSLRKRQALLTDEFSYTVYVLVLLPTGVVPWHTIHIIGTLSVHSFINNTTITFSFLIHVLNQKSNSDLGVAR